jgi:predicted helicase
MTTSGPIKSSHKAIKTYYEALEKYARQEVDHEMAVRSAFQNLLDELGRRIGWTLIPELALATRAGSIRPDGTFRDDYYITRGYWEAKDTRDKLETEIKRKITKGYPLTNAIFEDTHQAFLYQNGGLAMKVDLADPQKLADLLNAFFSHREPAHEDFNKAVGEFRERVPDLARALVEKIHDAHQNNPRFREAFGRFYELCRNSLNPNLSQAAVDEMLVQHLLTERLIRTIFDNADFTRRNVIAAEVEQVIDALTARSFDRHEFLKSLDRFYLAIERAAATMESFTEKQHFLNTVYERFFQGYSVKVADTHGIVYTPQEIVDFMCASVAEVLENEFGKRLGDPGVHILDPCTGTGNFIVNLLRRIPKKDLPRMYRRQLFANEVMLLPYYIAALNIEHAYYEQTGAYEPFEGLCFVDTLDLVEKKQISFEFMTELNAARVERQKNAPITVVIGNPPYNANQVNENDNNKNRKYDFVQSRIRTTFARESTATLKNKLYDPYVQFLRWALDRLEGRRGMVCMVTNNSFFVDGPPFDGMRSHLEQEFSAIYHIDLRGNVRQNPKLSGTKHNVFGIQVGVGITLAIRKGKRRPARLFCHRLPDDWRREKKLSWLSSAGKIGGVKWRRLKSDASHNWILPAKAAEYASLMPLGSEGRESIFDRFSTGAKSNRDDVVYDFDADVLANRVQAFAEAYNLEVDRYQRKPKEMTLDEFVDYSAVKWSSTLKLRLSRGTYATFDAGRIRHCLYRPFTKRLLYYDTVLNDRPGLFRVVLPTVASEDENRVICCTNHSQVPFVVIVTNQIANEAVGGRAGVCFPFYVYRDDGSGRRENITDWALKRFREHYATKNITKWDIFCYIYGLLHHPGYRDRYAENLKLNLPRIPLATDFAALADAGKRLARLHLDYEQLEPYPLQWIETPGVPLSYQVEKMRLSKDKTALVVNDSLTLAGIPAETYRYRLGNRSALEWVVDQYRVSEDNRSGIRSDPNRPDDPEYIVRLAGQVVRVSLETMLLIDALPADLGVGR